MRPSALPAFEDNYIWVLGEGRESVIVDPGECAPVLDAAAAGLQPRAILLTHHHPDHWRGVPGLLERWPDLAVFAPEDERIDLPCTRVGEGARLPLQDFRIDVIAVPGHTRSHIAYLAEGNVFCGDALFSLGCGRMFEGTAAQMHGSLQRLAALPAETRVCCGHEYTLANARFARMLEPDNARLAARQAQALEARSAGLPTLPSTIGSERDCNPFLRCDQAAIRSAVAARLGRPAESDTEVFATLRTWKNEFNG